MLSSYVTLRHLEKYWCLFLAYIPRKCCVVFVFVVVAVGGFCFCFVFERRGFMSLDYLIEDFL